MFSSFTASRSLIRIMLEEDCGFLKLQFSASTRVPDEGGDHFIVIGCVECRESVGDCLKASR